MDFPLDLSKRLVNELPGAQAHRKVMSYARDGAKEIRRTNSTYRESAVLILVYPDPSQVLHTVLIERPKYEGVHSGQIAFPGGAKEDSDSDLIETALREANEEVGLNSTEIQLVGSLTEVYIPPSNFIVHPVVAWMDKTPSLVADDYEVESILHVPILPLTKSEAIAPQKIRMSNGADLKVGAYTHENHLIWGATAMMIAEFTELVKDIT